MATWQSKHVSFRMPVDLLAEYAAYAESHGMDLTAVLNWALTEARPLLKRRLVVDDGDAREGDSQRAA